MLPPLAIVRDVSLLFLRQLRAGFGDRAQRPEAYSRSQLIYAIRLCKDPRSNAAITRIIHPLRTVNLRSTVIHRNPIFQICRVPEWDACFNRSGVEQSQHFPLKLRFTDCMLDDEPCRFGSVFAGNSLVGPTMDGNQLSKSGGVTDVYCFHSRNVAAAQLAGFEQFLPDSRILGTHSQKLPKQLFIDHQETLYRSCFIECARSPPRSRSQVHRGGYGRGRSVLSAIRLRVTPTYDLGVLI